MTAELAAAIPLAAITGWTLHAVWTRIGQARADACLRRLLAPRIASWRTDYTSQAGGRR